MNHLVNIVLTASTPSGATGSTAQGSGLGATGANAFWQSSIGGVLGTILAVVGVLVVLGTLFKVGQKAMKGETSKIIGPVIMALAVAAICFDPPLISSAISAMTSVVSAIISSASNLFTGGGASSVVS